MSRQQAEAVDLEDEDEDREADDDEADKASPKSPEQNLVRTVVNKKIDSLEDLYAAFPELGDGTGSFFVRLYRELPRQFAGQNIAGRINDFLDRLSYDQIQASYGGGRFKVGIMGPSKGRPNANGEMAIRQHQSFVFNLPGPPVPHVPVVFADSTDEREPEMASHAPTMMPHMVPVQTMVQPQGPSPQVALEKLKIEDRREVRQEEKQEQMLRQAAEAQNATLKQITDMAKEQNDHLRRQLEQQHVLAADKDRQIAETSKLQAKLQTDALLATRIAEESKAAREKAEQELNRLKDDQQRRFDDSERRHREMLDDCRRRFDDDKSRLERESAAERDRIREDARVREKAQQDEAERRVTSQRDQYEGRISDANRANEREINSIKESRDRDVRSAESQAHNQVLSIKSSADMKIAMLEEQRGRLQSDLDRLTKRFEELQKAAHKDPVQFIQETQTIARDVLGMVTAAEAAASGGSDEEEAPKDWQSMVARGVLGFVEKAPEMLQQVNAMRAQGAAMTQQRQQQQQQQQMQGGPSRALAQPPPPWQQQRGPRGVIAPMQVAEVRRTSMPASQTISSPSPFDVPPAQVPSQPSIFQAPQPMEQQQPAQQSVGQAAEPAASVELAARPSAFPPSFEGMSQEQLSSSMAEFVSQLDMAIKSVLPPGIFAQMVIDKAGPQAVAQFMLIVPSPDILFAEIDRIGADTEITTRDGKKYTRKVWEEAKAKLVSAAQ